MPKSKVQFAFSLLVPAPRRNLILAATSIAFTAGMMALATPVEARRIQWCSQIHGRGTTCMYHTYEQCRASISGRGGTCVRNRHG
jgi:hypothetical protein